MKLSDNTVNILKNFSSINSGIQFKEGDTLKTISEQRTIFVEATVDETFPKEFAIHDLNKFLAKISLYKEAHLSFGDDRINISTENKKRSAGISGSPHFVFESDGSTIYFIATDVKDDSADQSKIEIGTVEDNKKFRVVMRAEHFKLIEGSYDIEIAKKGLSRFKHKTANVTYYIAIEAGSSTFGE